MHKVCKLFSLNTEQSQLFHLRDDGAYHPCMCGHSFFVSQYNSEHTDFNWRYNSSWRIRNNDEERKWFI